MSEKFQNKYRISSARLQNWDYGWNAAYFVTICTHNHEKYFGNVWNRKMVLSETGIIADHYWHEIPNRFSYVRLAAFVVMPNHIHGILILNNNNYLDNRMDNDMDNGMGNGLDNGLDNGLGNGFLDNGLDNVDTRHALYLQRKPQPQKTTTTENHNPWKKTISKPG